MHIENLYTYAQHVSRSKLSVPVSGTDGFRLVLQWAEACSPRCNACQLLCEHKSKYRDAQEQWPEVRQIRTTGTRKTPQEKYLVPDHRGLTGVGANARMHGLRLSAGQPVFRVVYPG